MTEREWLQATDPAPMLEFLGARASGRKLRLFAVACCRRIWPLITEAHCREAVEIAEKFADGLVTAEVQEAAHRAAERVRQEVDDTEAPLFSGVAYATAYAASYTIHDKGTVWLACRAAVNAACAAGHALSSQGASETEVAAATQAEFTAQTALVRDLFGNPFRPPQIEPAWLTWNDGFIPEQAKLIYDERAFDRLPILGDALEDADCADRAILAHCRLPAEHVRGCWLVDALFERPS